MGACGTCRHNAVPTRTPAPLLQIRSGLRARWNTIDFQVEADSGQWTLRVKNSASSEILYTAHRGGSRAAQSGGVVGVLIRSPKEAILVAGVWLLFISAGLALTRRRALLQLLLTRRGRG